MFDRWSLGVALREMAKMTERREHRMVYITSVMASFARQDLEMFRRHGRVDVFHFAPARKVYTPWVMLLELWFLLRCIRGASIVVTQFVGYHAFLPVLLGKLFRVPTLLVLGGTESVKFPSFGYGDHVRWPLRAFSRWSLAHASHLAPVDESLVECTYTYSTNPDDPLRQGYRGLYPWIRTPHTTLAYGYDPDRFRPQGIRLPGTFLTVSKMNAANFMRKGIDLIFEMARRFPDQRFTIVGDSPGMVYPQVPANVELVKAVTYDELPAYYSCHTFYLQLSQWEGFPSAPCEAMLCGCVPIVSRVAALPEIVGEAGLILDRKDPDELERLIRKALTLDTDEVGKQARARIMERWPKDNRMRLMRLVRDLSRFGQEVDRSMQ